MKGFFHLVFPFLFAFVPALLPGAESETLTRTFGVDGPGKLVVDSDMGLIEVTGRDAAEVRIEVHIDYRTRKAGRAAKTRERMHFDFDQEGDRITAVLDYENGGGGWFGGEKSPDVTWIISLPTDMALELNTGGGSISVNGMRGQVTGRTSGGHIELQAVEGDVSVRTSGGHIACEAITGDMELRTSGGHIAVRHSAGAVDARTSGGHIEIDHVRGVVDARTSGGHIEAALAGPLRGDCSLRTSGGGIELLVDDRVSADLYAHTSVGEVMTNVPILLEGKLRSNRVVGKIGAGGPRLELETSAGSIRIFRAED